MAQSNDFHACISLIEVKREETSVISPVFVMSQDRLAVAKMASN